MRALTSSPASSRTASDISVSTTPGATAFTMILRGANSTASARVNALTAPLLAGHRAYVDDLPAALRNHVRGHGARHVEHARHVRADDVVDVGIGKPGK